jgi:hypothetical protein
MRELGSFPTSYIPTPATFTGRSSTARFYDSAGVIQTAASGVARSNAFFPDSSGVMRPAGLLLEAAGTNIIVSSQVFNSGGWTLDGASLTTNAATAPDGTTTATSIVQGTGNNRAYHFDNSGVLGSKVFSIFAKANAGTSLEIRSIGGVSPVATATVNLSIGTVSGFTGATVEKYPSGWYRVLLPVTVSIASGSSTYWTITGPASSVLIWGAQLETGSYATSYIPTVASTVTRAADTSTSATVTRSADVANMTGTNFSSWFNQLQGSVFCQFNPVDVGNYYIGVWGVEADPVNVSGFGLSKNDLTGRTFRAQFYFNFNKTGGSPASIELGDNTMPAFVTNKSALVYSSTGVSGAINALLGTNTSSQPVGSATMNTLHLGRHYHSYYPVIINGTIARLAYWPTRLSDTVLQAITR